MKAQPSAVQRLKKPAYVLAILAVLLSVLMISGGTALAEPIVHYVDVSATDGAKNGTSWAAAYTDLQDALAKAEAGEEIWVAAGTYKPTADSDRSKAFVLAAGVELYGGFAGNETARSQRDWEANVTILSGEIGDEALTTDNSYRVVSCTGSIYAPVITAVLDGFTITGGRADGPSDADRHGGGMSNYRSSPIVRNVVFANNYAGTGAAGGGGGMANRRDSSPLLTNVSFFNNQAQYDGGGMYNHTRSSPTLTDVVFSGNQASERGAGMWNHFSCSPTLTRVVFSGNSTGPTSTGGGIYAAENCSITLNDVSFASNSARAGGGIALANSSAVLRGATFANNTASSGGAFYAYNATLTIADSLFRGNSAIGEAGALYISTSSATVTNTIFSNNTVDAGLDSAHGGAVSNYGSSLLRFTNVSFAGNVAGSSGGALRNWGPTSPVLVNCILWGNTAKYEGAQIYNHSGGSATVSYSIVQGGWTGAGSDNLNVDPLFVDAAAGDLRLRTGSPAIDACPSGPDFDLEGVSRPQGAGYDMGAYEYVGGILYVKHDATGNNDGSSWTDAFIDPQSALGLANAGDEIWVARGTYKPTSDTDRTKAFVLKPGVAFYGGFAGTETAREQRDWETNATILSGEIGNAGVTTVNSYHVVKCVNHISQPTLTAVLDGFTVTGGRADRSTSPSDSDANGAGMYNYKSSPLVQNMVFSGNFAAWGGGGMYNYYQSSPTLVNVTFERNEAQLDGGGMFNHDRSSPTLTDVIFRDNVTEWSWSVGGGGLGNFLLCSPTLTRVTFLDNSASGNGSGGGISADNQCSLAMDEVSFSGNSAGNGGGIRLYDRGSAVLRDVTFTANTASSSGGALYASGNCTLDITDTVFDGHSAYDGGAMRVDESSTTLTDVTFSDNSSSGHGGGLYYYMGTATLTDVTFSDNSAYDGGGMYIGASSPTLTNVAFSGNSAEGAGGGLYNYDSSPILTDVGFTGNSAQYGGGICNSGNYGSSPILANVVFSGNSAAMDGGGMANYGSSPTLTNVTFDDNSASQYGGGMHNYWGSSPTLTNIVYSRNSADHGGGMYNEGSSPALTNVTFGGNAADSSGGALHNGYDSSPKLTNCILWGNNAPLGPEVHNSSYATATITYSTVKMESVYPGTGNLNDDPKFVDAASGDLRLRAGSPAIDAGNNEAPGLSGIDKDIRGYPRIFDGNGDGTAVVDMGAYELIDAIPPVVTPPIDKTAEATSSAGASVSWEATATDTVDGSRPVHYYLAYGTAEQTEITSPRTFPLGETIVTCAATDLSGNTGTATFKVTVTDTTPPAVSGFTASPASPIVGQPVTVRATVTDIASLIAGAEYRLDSGSWKAMSPSDGSFDSQTEEVRVTLSGLAAGFYTVRVRATDTASPPNTSSGFASLTFRVGAAPLPTFTLTYLAGEGGTISGQAQQVVEYGKSGTEVTAVPNTGYEFVRWSGGLTTSSRTDRFVTSDLTVTAEFRLIASPPPPPPPPPGDHWTDITDAQWMSFYGLKAEDVAQVADGYTDGTFRPFIPITRAQFAKMALAGLGVAKHFPTENAYSDVPASHDYFGWVEGARHAGLITGYPDGTFRPEALITRQQANTILGRYLVERELAARGHIAGSSGTYASLGAWFAAEGGGVLASFADASVLASVHAPYTAYLVYRGVVLGSASGGNLYLRPLADLVRAQAVALILRVEALD